MLSVALRLLWAQMRLLCVVLASRVKIAALGMFYPKPGHAKKPNSKHKLSLRISAQCLTKLLSHHIYRIHEIPLLKIHENMTKCRRFRCRARRPHRKSIKTKPNTAPPGPLGPPSPPGTPGPTGPPATPGPPGLPSPAHRAAPLRPLQNNYKTTTKQVQNNLQNNYKTTPVFI